jgi:hypothetical protein
MLRPYLVNPLVDVSDRHLAHPPAQWIVFFLSSVALHGLAFGLLSGFVGQQRTAKINQEPVPVQLIDLSAIAPQTQSPQPQITSSLPSQTIPAPVQKTPIQRSEAPTTTIVSPVTPPRSTKPSTSRKPVSRNDNSPERKTVKPSPTKGSRKSRIARRSPTASRIAVKPSASASRSSGSSNSKPAPQESSQPTSQASPSPTTSNSPATSPKPSASPQTTSASKPTRSPAQNSDSSSPAKPPGKVQGAESQQGGSLVATLSDIHLANGGTDVPDQLAKPRQQEKRFSGVGYPAKAGLSPNQVVVLQVLLLIDHTGQPQVQTAQMIQGSNGVNAEQLAREIIQNWKFQPATQAGQAVDSLLKVVLTVNPHAT